MSNKVVYAENGNARMEAETISKNGRSSKSQMSKGNIFKFISIFFVAFCVIITGCNKEDENKNEGVVKLLETMSEGDGYYTTMFEYDSQNRITKVLEYRDGKLSFTNTVNYNGDEFKITSSYVDDNRDNREQIFRKTGNTITFVNEYEDDDYSSSIKWTITINNDGFITKVDDIISETDCWSKCETTTWTSEYTFTYQGNNVTKIISVDKYIKNEEVIDYTTTIDYKYDNYKSPMYHCKTPKWLLFTLYDGFGLYNNVTEEKYVRTVYDPWNRTTTYKYEYDSDGYPIKRTETSSGSGSIESEYVTIFTYITK